MNYPVKKAWFFNHTECEYFPCHATDKPEDFNCLFCYCPLYTLGEACEGNYFYTAKGVKNCSLCIFPHERNSFSTLTKKFPALMKMAEKKAPDSG